MWIKLEGKFYNLNHIRRITIEEQIRFEYSNGDSVILYGLSNDEVLKLIKYLEYDSRANS